MAARLIGILFLGLCIIVVGIVIFQNSPNRNRPLVFSPTQMLTVLWGRYTQDYLEPGSYRTLDKQRGNITTSEGQAYTMLRAVWVGDKTVFDRSWDWTRTNIQHKNDHLFSWLYGKRNDGSYGVISAEGGSNAASDADTDIALSLIFAYARWQDAKYLDAARMIIADIWEKEVILVGTTPYLAANDVEKVSASNAAIVNPSYFAPYAYRIFSKVDPSHDWLALVDSSYALIERAAADPLDTGTSAGLPPNWIQIDKKTGDISAAPPNLTTYFGYDALRTPWRLALDWEWNREPRAAALLKKFSSLSSYWKQHGTLPSVLAHDGTVIDAQESPAMYGGALGYFLIADPDAAKDIYERKILFLYDPGANNWKQDLGYYGSNIAWFGIGIYNKLLPDLTRGLGADAFTSR